MKLERLTPISNRLPTDKDTEATEICSCMLVVLTSNSQGYKDKRFHQAVVSIAPWNIKHVTKSTKFLPAHVSWLISHFFSAFIFSSVNDTTFNDLQAISHWKDWILWNLTGPNFFTAQERQLFKHEFYFKTI